MPLEWRKQLPIFKKEKSGMCPQGTQAWFFPSNPKETKTPLPLQPADPKQIDGGYNSKERCGGEEQILGGETGNWSESWGWQTAIIRTSLAALWRPLWNEPMKKRQPPENWEPNTGRRELWGNSLDLAQCIKSWINFRICRLSKADNKVLAFWEERAYIQGDLHRNGTCP